MNSCQSLACVVVDTRHRIILILATLAFLLVLGLACSFLSAGIAYGLFERRKPYIYQWNTIALLTGPGATAVTVLVAIVLYTIFLCGRFDDGVSDGGDKQRALFMTGALSVSIFTGIFSTAAGAVVLAEAWPSPITPRYALKLRAAGFGVWFGATFMVLAIGIIHYSSESESV